MLKVCLIFRDPRGKGNSFEEIFLDLHNYFKIKQSNFWNLTKSIFSKAIIPLKTISDDSIRHPKGHASIPGKSQNL